MKIHYLVVAMIALLAGAAAAQEPSPFKNEKEKVSYALGLNLAKQLRAQSLDVDADVLTRGLKDALAGGKTLLTEQELGTIVAAVRKNITVRQASAQREQARVQKEAAGKNKAAGEAFLAANKVKPGVVTLPSGLQYKIIKEGKGKTPVAEDVVGVHYRGTLIDGTEFDSSYARKKPATFGVNRVIKGWTEALERMPVGSEWQLVIPPDLAYGPRGAGKQIGPNATLIFNVELLSIADRTAAGGAAGRDTATERIAGGSSAPRSAPAIASLGVTFKMDPRLATGSYGGADRWVAPPTYVKVGDGKSCAIDARVEAKDAAGKRTDASATWSAADPQMVAITPAKGGEVQLLVQRPGSTTVRVASEQVSTALAIKADYQNDVLKVEITQK